MLRRAVCWLAVVLALAAPARGSVEIVGSDGSSKLAVGTDGSALVRYGKTTRAVHVASASALTTTTTYSLQVNAGVSLGYKLLGWCVGYTGTTAAAVGLISVNRRSTASSGGTALTVEGTGATAISKMDPGASNFSGAGAATPTLGTLGATLDQQGFTWPFLATGNTTPPPICRWYSEATGMLPPVVAAGTANGISIVVTGGGAGGIADGSITMFIAEE